MRIRVAYESGKESGYFEIGGLRPQRNSPIFVYNDSNG